MLIPVVLLREVEGEELFGTLVAVGEKMFGDKAYTIIQKGHFPESEQEKFYSGHFGFKFSCALEWNVRRWLRDGYKKRYENGRFDVKIDGYPGDANVRILAPVLAGRRYDRVRLEVSEYRSVGLDAWSYCPVFDDGSGKYDNVRKVIKDFVHALYKKLNAG